MKEREKEREKEGEWAYMAEMDEYYWTGDNEPPVYFNDNPEYISPKGEEKENCFNKCLIKQNTYGLLIY